MKLFKFFQFEKYYYPNFGLNVGNWFKFRSEPSTELRDLRFRFMGSRYRKMAKDNVTQPFRSSRVNGQDLGEVRQRSFCMATFMKWLMLITILEMLRKKILNEEKTSLIYHYHFYADVYECICVTQVCDTTHILVFINTMTAPQTHTETHTIFNSDFIYQNVLPQQTHTYHIWNNIINCFADKIEV